MDYTLTNLKAIIAAFLVVDPNEIQQLDSFAALGLDSLDHLQLLTECEDQFEVVLAEDAANCRTVAGLYDAILRAQGITA